MSSGWSWGDKQEGANGAVARGLGVAVEGRGDGRPAASMREREEGRVGAYAKGRPPHADFVMAGALRWWRLDAAAPS